eukprot:TRINITY_DN18001_c0_g1_i1.p1 TRINITY_DN18001_c0_g1~~TRINITY_DN18001_c0_g1_i1.p1  ORF type:complete len:117 (+),score=15.55 TRINITY_DN18001_c0_g1_i1:65-415(+)
MSLLRAATRLGSRSLSTAATPTLRTVAAATRPPMASAQRSIMTLSQLRRGHNLEDHYDMAEYVCKMHTPSGEYLWWFAILVAAMSVFGPLLHSNYYFTGRFLPKDQGNTQLCDDSW